MYAGPMGPAYRLCSNPRTAPARSCTKGSAENARMRRALAPYVSTYLAAAEPLEVSPEVDRPPEADPFNDVAMVWHVAVVIHR